MNHNGKALEFASEALQADRKLVLVAIDHVAIAFSGAPYVSTVLCDDKAVKTLARQRGSLQLIRRWR